ncbi:MAG TPA: hypothetical protein VF581_07840 [Flavobacterium sp.]|jgi:hypothetical protein
MLNKVEISQKLNHCRETAKNFFKTEYQEKLKPYTVLVESVMRANEEGELEALIRISGTHTYQDSGLAQMMFMAATVELIDPIKN